MVCGVRTEWRGEVEGKESELTLLSFISCRGRYFSFTATRSIASRVESAPSMTLNDSKCLTSPMLSNSGCLLPENRVLGVQM